MGYEYEHDVVSELGHLGMEYNSNAHYEMAGEVEEVYAKARAFDEIVNEFGHYVDTLPSWETIDHKDTRTLLDIIKENMEGK
ncbi:hypothetical protein [Staphylococcus phage ZCSS1]|nr:hypothetical protein [Staphylococcus phage ZCSS1]